LPRPDDRLRESLPESTVYLEHGADPNFRIPWMHDRTHLHRAWCTVGASPSSGASSTRAAIRTPPDDLGLTPFRSAVRRGRDDVADLLRAAGGQETSLTADDRMPARIDPDLLCYAAGRNDLATVRRLLDRGADPNALGGLDETSAAPLGVLARVGRGGEAARGAGRGHSRAQSLWR
jgi:ankyrin repeat protein